MFILYLHEISIVDKFPDPQCRLGIIDVGGGKQLSNC